MLERMKADTLCSEQHTGVTTCESKTNGGSVEDLARATRLNVVAFTTQQAGFTPFPQVAFGPQPLPAEKEQSGLQKFLQLKPFAGLFQHS
jgi:hypothetical protein